MFLLTLLLGCGLDNAIGCDFREGSANGPEPRCQERTGVQSNGFGEFCETLGGTAIEGGCPLDGAVAGCTAGAPGGDITDWHYPPTTLAEVEEDCDGEVVEP